MPMIEDKLREQPTALEKAQALIGQTEKAAAQKAELIAELRAQRESIDQALVALGAKRVRRAAAKPRGRPVGSRNKKPAVVPEAVA